MDLSHTENRRAWVIGVAVPALAALSLTAAGPATGARDGSRAPSARAALAATVVGWNAVTSQVATDSCVSLGNHPPLEARLYAVESIAVSDALNAVHRRYRGYTFSGHAERAAATAAIAAAAHDALEAEVRAMPFGDDCASTGLATLETAYHRAVTAIPDGARKQRGLVLGRRAAAAIVAARAHDGSDQPPVVADYPQGTAPGKWRFTPGTSFAFAPDWGRVTPFALRNAAQFLPDQPYALTARAYARDYREVKRLGGDGVTTPSGRTTWQTETALFWLESSPASWNRLARTLATRRHLGAWRSARMFGLLNMAMADGYIGSFYAKYDTYRFWRPVTAIRLGGTDGNPRTVADPDWTPLVVTPPVPDHDSGHAVEGAAAAAVLARVLGTDRVRFSVCSTSLTDGPCDSPRAVLHHFTRLSTAAHQNGISRVLVGFHFRHAVESGLRHGRRIASYVVRHELPPVG